MRNMIIGLSALAFASLPSLAFADGDGVLTGAAGGAVAGGVIGGAASQPRPEVVAPGPGAPPCNTRTTTTQNDNTGASVTRQTTDCPE